MITVHYTFFSTGVPHTICRKRLLFWTCALRTEETAKIYRISSFRSIFVYNDYGRFKDISALSIGDVTYRIEYVFSKRASKPYNKISGQRYTDIFHTINLAQKHNNIYETIIVVLLSKIDWEN